MTTEVTQDFNWDEPLTTDAGGDGKRQFAKVRMIVVPVQPFQKGEAFTLPDVHDDQYNEESKTTTRKGLKSFNGMKIGKTEKNHHIYVLVATKADREGKEYQRVKWFKSWLEKGRKNVWAELQFPALKVLDVTSRDKLIKGGIFAAYDELPTGEQVNIQGKDFDTKYWGKFTVFADEAAMKAAEREFFAQFATANGTTPLDLKNIPAKWLTADNPGKWAADVAAMSKYIKESAASMSVIDLAKTFSVVDKETGKPFPNQEGKPIDPVALLAPILDVPPASLMATFA